ncbi:MAG: thioredoxin domain-containing protein [Saprospiraceae bacterium]
MRLFICLLFSIGFLSADSQGIEFFHGTWAEALTKAAEEDKIIFVDAYAKWCGPCKRMAKNVFTHASTGVFYNANFINMKLDMEESESRDFKKYFRPSAYPTLYFIDDKGKLIKKVVGGRSTKDFVQLGKDVIKSYDRSSIYAKQYEKGDKSYDLVLDYVKALNKADKPSQKITNDFIRENPSLSNQDLSILLYEALVLADSKVFDLFIKNRKSIENLYSKKEVEEKIEASCWATVYNAVEFEVDGLLEEAKEKCKDFLPVKSKSFVLESEYEYYKGIEDNKKMSEAALKMAKKLHRKNPKVLHNISKELLTYSNNDASTLAAAEKLAKMTLDNDKKNQDYLLFYAKILFANKKSTEALKYAKKSLDLHAEKEIPSTEVEKLIEEIQSK